MFIGKSQANNMGLFSTLIYILTRYIVILIIIIINSGLAGAQMTKKWLFLDRNVITEPVEISERAIKRRETRGHTSSPTEYDLTLSQEYIDTIESAGLTVHHFSRWLSAVSVSGDEAALSAAMTLPFVTGSKSVASFTGRRFEQEELTPAMVKALSASVYTALDYGPSYTPIHLCQIDSLHDLNFTGEGVLIGVMDTGFNLEHPAMSHIIDDGRLLGTYDFINDDENVQDSLSNEQEHGTAVWSVIGAYAEGSMIGAAYGAQFLLAKTEIRVPPDQQSEEDNWIAAVEWMEAEGVDIVSSSVGYLDWYEWGDLDGDTPLITAAADYAAHLGVVVVNSAGNERGNTWNTLIVPADGDSVIAAGGVNSDGTLWYASSPGPTADGRIKPDICAQSIGVPAAYYYSGGYHSYSGTSFSAPMIAGGLALILEAHPDWDVGTIIDNLKLYGSKSGNPDNDFGWGIARFADMYHREISTIMGAPIFVAPHPARGTVVFHFDPPLNGATEIIIYTVAGDRVKTILLSPIDEAISEVNWNARNFSGDVIASGIYLAHLQSPSACRTIKFAFVK